MTHARVLHLISLRSADIALVAGGNRRRWIIATENMQVGDTLLNSDSIGRMAGEGKPQPGVRGKGLIDGQGSWPGRR